MLKLHCFGESGHSYKVALALELAGLCWEPARIDFFKGEARSDAFRSERNIMGEAPVLDTGAELLTQSGAILDWIGEETGRFWGASRAETREVWRWVLWDNHKLSGVNGTLRFLMNFLPEKHRKPDVIAWLDGRAKGSYAILDAHLAGRDWIAGRDITAADLSCASYLFYDEPFGFDRDAYPNIDAWLDRIAALPGWKHPYDLMPRAFAA